MKAILIGLVILAVASIVVIAQGRKESPVSAAGQPATADAPRTGDASAAGGSGSGDFAQGDFATRTLSWQELAVIMAEKDPNTYLVDVRTPGEFNSGAIPGAVNIPHTEIGSAPPTDDRSARIIVYCRSGSRSSAAKLVLDQLGYTNVNDFGGVYRWEGDLVQSQ